jgi:hypothetical protein
MARKFDNETSQLHDFQTPREKIIGNPSRRDRRAAEIAEPNPLSAPSASLRRRVKESPKNPHRKNPANMLYW